MVSVVGFVIVIHRIGDRLGSGCVSGVRSELPIDLPPELV